VKGVTISKLFDHKVVYDVCVNIVCIFYVYLCVTTPKLNLHFCYYCCLVYNKGPGPGLGSSYLDKD
jgi:hypothetical protein